MSIIPWDGCNKADNELLATFTYTKINSVTITQLFNYRKLVKKHYCSNANAVVAHPWDGGVHNVTPFLLLPTLQYTTSAIHNFYNPKFLQSNFKLNPQI